MVQGNYFRRTRLVTHSTCKTCLVTHSTHLTTSSTRTSRLSAPSTRSTCLSICLSTRNTHLSTRSICLSARSTCSTICRSLYNWSTILAEIWSQHKFGLLKYIMHHPHVFFLFESFSLYQQNNVFLAFIKIIVDITIVPLSIGWLNNFDWFIWIKH